MRKNKSRYGRKSLEKKDISGIVPHIHKKMLGQILHKNKCYEGMKTVQTLLSMMRNLILVAEQPQNNVTCVQVTFLGGKALSREIKNLTRALRMKSVTK